VFKSPEAGVDLMVDRGLRATLQSANLLTGQMLVALEFVHDAPAAKVTTEDGAFVLPTSNASGFSDLTPSPTDLPSKVNTIPFDTLGRSLDQAVAGLDSLVNGPQLKQALVSLDATLSSVQETVQHLDNGLSPAMKKLPAMAASLEQTLTSANKLVLSLQSGYGDNTQFNRDLNRLLIQLNDATRSIRSLADLLARHPEALIKGRANTGSE